MGKTFRIDNADEKMAARVALYKTALPDCFEKLEKLLVANGDTGYFVGDSLTVADLCVWRCMGWFTAGVLDGIGKDVAAKFTKLNGVLANVDAHPKVVEWKALHPENYKK